MIECIIVDDEKIILEELCEMIQRPSIKIVGAFQDPLEAFQNIKILKPNVVFLDIEMPGINGIELAKKIAKLDFEIQIVFVTAYEQYALKAFEVAAIHYLLKPITMDKIEEAIQRVENVKKMNTAKGVADKPRLINGIDNTSRISVKNRDSLFIIKTKDIIYLKSENGKTIIYTVNGSYSSRNKLEQWENKLKNLGFIRCHRSFIVNVNYITKMIHVLGDYRELCLDYCDINIPISRQKINELKTWFQIN
ncbi:MAG: response regulator transcription factor [Clostridia bacterium]|nr:response regulator transcription factor [Clostridia bacterium]